MLTIGILEDEEFIYLPWEKAAERCTIPCRTIWIKDIDDCYLYLKNIDILVADRIIESGGIEHDLLLDGHIEKIANVFKGPIVLSSDAEAPKRYTQYFSMILKNKIMKDLNSFLISILPKVQSKLL